MSGALGRKITAELGQDFVGDFGGFGSVSVSFAD
jgi:2-keto-4-pentenoate hydratase